MTDVLDGFRDVRDSRDASLRLGRAIEAADPGEDTEIWDRMYLGQAAQKIMLGVSTQQDMGRILSNMIAQCEIDCQEASRVFIAQMDPASPVAREAHYRARIAAGILGKLNGFIRDGLTAADIINDSDKE